MEDKTPPPFSSPVRAVDSSPRPVGYLSLGMVVFAVRPELLSAGGTVHLLAELGVVFLLFDIGPHFSTAHVRHEAGDIFGFGSL
jgi:Kef-type K+ transport system membrane component KefB